MDSKPQTQPQSEVEKPKKPARRRGASTTIVSESPKEVVMSIAHEPHKGEKVSATIRRDRKFNPKQRVTDLNGRAL